MLSLKILCPAPPAVEELADFMRSLITNRMSPALFKNSSGYFTSIVIEDEHMVCPTNVHRLSVK